MSQDLFAIVLAAIVAAAAIVVWAYCFASSADQPAARAVLTFGAYSPAGHWRWRPPVSRHRARRTRALARAMAALFRRTVDVFKAAIIWAVGDGLEKPAPGWEPRGDWWNEPGQQDLPPVPLDALDADAEAARRRRYARLTAGDNGGVPLELDLGEPRRTAREDIRPPSRSIDIVGPGEIDWDAARRAAEGEFLAEFGPGLDLASFNVDPGAAAERLSQHLAAGRAYVRPPMSEVEREFRAACEPRGPLQFELDGKTGESADVAAGYGWLPDRVKTYVPPLPAGGSMQWADDPCTCSDCVARDWEPQESVYDDEDNAPLTAQDVADAEAVARLREAARAELAAALADEPEELEEPPAVELAGPVEHEDATADWSPLAEVGADDKPTTLAHTTADLRERDILAEFDACVEDARTLPPWLVALAVTVDEDLERAGRDSRAHGMWRQTWLSMPTGEWRPVAA